MKKLLALVLALALLANVGLVLAEDTEYVFEAEYTYLEGLEGLGVSGSPTGIGLASESGKASNEFYVGNLGVKSPITFKITADADCTAML